MAGASDNGDGRAEIQELGGKANLRDDMNEAIFIWYSSGQLRWRDVVVG